MAAGGYDGSLKFDTKIDDKGFDDGVSTLTKAVDILAKSVDRLSGNIVKAFNQSNSAAVDASEGVEEIGKKAEKSENQVKSLQEQMDAIHVQTMPDSVTDTASPEPVTVSVDSKNFGYDKAAMEFIEQYSQKAENAGGQTNEFRQEIERLQGQMKQMEDQGLWWGDDAYDTAYLKLRKVEQALKDYKKELISPAPDANPFGVDTMSGKILEIQSRLQKLAEAGKGLGDAEYDELYRRLAIAKEEAKDYAAELAKTPKMLEKENQLLAEKQAKLEATAQKEAQRQAVAQARETARIAAEEKVLQAKLATEVQEELEQQRLKKIADTAQISSKKVIELRKELDRLNARQADLEKAGLGLGYQEYDVNASQISDIKARLSEYENEITRSERRTGLFASVSKQAFGGVKKAFAGLGKAIGSKFTEKVKETAAGIKGIISPANKAGTSILKLSNMFKLMLIRMAMRAVIQGVKEGMQNLVQYSDNANRSISSLMSGMTYLKNSFAAAFAPILTYVAPVLNTLINLLGTATNYVAQFFSALGGGSTFVRAKKVNEDYAKSLKSTGSAAGAAGKEAKKALAPFDDLVQIQQQETTGSGGGGAGATDPSQMFETASIENNIGDFANKLRELFDAGDWTGIGELIGEKINEGVQAFGDYISWDRVGAEVTAFMLAFTGILNSAAKMIDWYAIGTAAGTGVDTLLNTLYLFLTQMDWFVLGTAIASGLNGMVDTIDWNLFGATIGAYFQAKISALYGFVQTADWPGIGQAIGNSLNGMTGQIDWEMLGLSFAVGLSGIFDIVANFAETYDWVSLGNSVSASFSSFFETFDWAGAGAALSLFVLGFLNFLITVVQETDWRAFGEGVADGIKAIDWTTIVNSLFTFIGSCFGGLAALLGGLLADGVSSAKEYFQGKVDECGGNIVAGILKGILDGIIGIGLWIYKNVVAPIIDGFAAGFGFEGKSPSTVMAEMGQYLWDGFCNGIKAFFSSPGDFIKEHITDPFVDGVKNLLGIHSPSTVMEGIGSNTVAGFNQGVTNEQAASRNAVQSWASGISSWFADKFGIGNNDAEESRKWAVSIMSGFNSAVSRQYTNSQAVMEKWAENVRRWFTGTSESKGINEPAWGKFAADVVKAFSGAVNTKHAETQKPMETWAENVRKWFTGKDAGTGVNTFSWIKFGRDIIQAFDSSIGSGHAESREPMESWAGHVREWFWGDTDSSGTGGLYAAFYDMARRINEGFTNGIGDFASMAKRAIREWADEIMEEAEEAFDIHSPSREFHTIAEYVVKGFNDGISDLASSSRSAAQKWLDSVLEVFNGAGITVPVGLDMPSAAFYLPNVASGAVVPPRAGEASISMRNNAGGQEEMFTYLLQKIDELMAQMRESEGSPIEIVLNLTGNLASLARILKPELDKEAARKGVRLVITGGA